MTAEEMEVAYCKARITCMKSFVRWQREHVKTAKDALELGLTHEQVLKLTIGAMEMSSDMMDKELAGVMLISEMEKTRVEHEPVLDIHPMQEPT